MAGERSFDRYGAKVSDLSTAWGDRLVDAEKLMISERYATAITMSLYAIEILLKVRICQKLDLPSLPKPFEIHDLAGLLVLSGLSRTINLRNARLVKSNWTKVKVCATELNDLRYQPDATKSREEAEELFLQLNDPKSGVIQWVLSQP